MGGFYLLISFKLDMLDKDKLIIVAYICVSGMSNAKAAQICHEVREHLIQCFDDSIKTLVFPTNEPTHVDAINPKYVAIEYNEQEIRNTIETAKGIVNEKEVVW